jgi:hypothetical protein
MLQLLIIVLAALGVAWNIDPTLRPYVNVAVWSICAVIMLVMGARFDALLRRWEAKPHWRRVRTRAAEGHRTNREQVRYLR